MLLESVFHTTYHDKKEFFGQLMVNIRRYDLIKDYLNCFQFLHVASHYVLYLCFETRGYSTFGPSVSNVVIP